MQITKEQIAEVMSAHQNGCFALSENLVTPFTREVKEYIAINLYKIDLIPGESDEDLDKRCRAAWNTIPHVLFER